MEFRPIPDALQRTQALEAGDVDLIQTVNALDTSRLRADYQVVTDYDSEQTYAVLSASKPPFNNVHARRALAFATDRAALVQSISGNEDVGMDTSPFEESSKWGGLAPEDTGYPLYDPAKAQEELALYKLGMATTEQLQIMQTLSEQWKQVGIEAELDTVKAEELIGVLVGGTAQAIMSRGYGYPDPDQEYVFWGKEFASGSIIINFGQWYDDTTQAALELGRQTSDLDLRKQAYDSLVQERNANAADLWLFNTPWALIGDKNIRGLNWFRTLGFGTFTAKPWITSLWLDPAA
jgi:peptide/nickel transport system substrate-binding protein